MFLLYQVIDQFRFFLVVWIFGLSLALNLASDKLVIRLVPLREVNKLILIDHTVL